MSGVDINTQQSFEALNQRAVAVVIDPVQSVKGKVVIDCFRLINPQLMMLGHEPRQTTSNVGHLKKASIQALIHGLNRHYYSMVIDYRKNKLEEQMLTNLYKKTWKAGLTTVNFDAHADVNHHNIASMSEHSKNYNSRIKEEDGKTAEELLVANVGKIDPKRHLGNSVDELMAANILQVLGTMLSTIVF
jgi:26S proteasome regulatory subunit N11